MSSTTVGGSRSLLKNTTKRNSNIRSLSSGSGQPEGMSSEQLSIIKETVDSIRSLKQLCTISKQRVTEWVITFYL